MAKRVVCSSPCFLEPILAYEGYQLFPPPLGSNIIHDPSQADIRQVLIPYTALAGDDANDLTSGQAYDDESCDESSSSVLSFYEQFVMRPLATRSLEWIDLLGIPRASTSLSSCFFPWNRTYSHCVSKYNLDSIWSWICACFFGCNANHTIRTNRTNCTVRTFVIGRPCTNRTKRTECTNSPKVLLRLASPWRARGLVTTWTCKRGKEGRS